MAKAALGDVCGAVTHGLLHSFAAIVELLGIRRLDVERLRIFDGLDVGAEEEELPVVGLALLFDELGDFFVRVIVAGVLVAIGECDDDHLPRALVLGEIRERLAEVVDGAAHGIEQGGHPARDIGLVRQWRNVSQIRRRDQRAVFVVKQDERELGSARLFELFFDKGVEAANGFFGHGIHGAATVENEGDMCEVIIHAPTITVGVGHLWGEGEET